MAEYQRLDEICHINMGQSPDSKSYNQEGIGLPFFQGNADFGAMYPETRVWCNSPTKIVEPGTLLISVRAPIGALNYAKERSCIGRGLAGITSQNGVNLKYIYYCLKGKNAELNAKGTGSTFKAIAKNALGETSVRIIPEEEQLQIVQILDRVSFIVESRKQQLVELDNLIKARFVEMFGDPESNPCGWPVKKLEVVVASITAGWSANGEARPKKAGEKAVLKVSAVTRGFFKPDEHKVIPADIEIKKYVYPQKGDLLFSRANTRELVGATAIIEQDYPELLLPDKLWKVLFTNEMNVYYAKHILSTQAIRKVFSSQSTGTSGSMYNVSADKFRETLIPVPPMMLQREFASFVQQTDKSKFSFKNGGKEARFVVKCIWESLCRGTLK